MTTPWISSRAGTARFAAAPARLAAFARCLADKAQAQRASIHNCPVISLLDQIGPFE
jgi:hypothetical protein